MSDALCHEVLEQWGRLRDLHAARLEQNRLIDDLYHGRADVPLPELDEREKSSAINFFTKGIDAYAARIASNPMHIEVPSRKPGVKTHDDRARDKKRCLYGWWANSHLDTLDLRHARHLIAHSCAPMVIRPDFKAGVPVWRIRDPLAALPAETADPDDPHPPYSMFEYQRTWRWLSTMYPDQAARVSRPADTTDEDRFTIVEKVDDAWLCTFAVGGPSNFTHSHRSDGEYYKDRVARHSRPGRSRWVGQAECVLLERVPNRAGVPLAVIPGRVSLGEPMGQFDSLVGAFFTRALLMALEIRAVKEAVYPQQWLEEDPNGEGAEIVVHANPLKGIIGRVAGGRINTVQLVPGYQTYPTIDRLERTERVEGGIPAEFTGESPTNVRTGRRGEDIVSATIDFGIMEAQKVVERARLAENEVAVAVAKGWFGKQRKSFYVPAGPAKGHFDYVADDLWDTTEHTVRYSHPGHDANGLTIRVGQMTGMELMSKHSARRKLPDIDDPEQEHDHIVAEQLEAAGLAAIQNMAAQGQIPPADVARIAQLVRSDRMDWAEAVMQVQREAQERQAEQAPPGSPETQPGIAMPGTGAEAQTGGVPPDLAHMTSLMGALRLGQNAAPQEAAAEAAAVMG